MTKERRDTAIQYLLIAVGLWLISYFDDPRGPDWFRVSGWILGLAAFLYAEFLLLTRRGGDD